MIGKPTTVEAILEAKEERAIKQKELLARFPLTSLISLSINIPSSIKLSHEAVVIHECASQSIISILREEGIELLWYEHKMARTGAESLFVCKADAKALKRLTCSLEESHALGRLMDMDVLDFSGTLLSRSELGLAKRRCFVCEKEAHLCARAQQHSYTELNLHIKHLVEKHAFANSIALWCERAMKTEVELTPKPGLVDCANSGAHRDMDIHTFYTSIKAIKPFIPLFIHAAQESADEEAKTSFQHIRKIGIACEKAMFEATSGVNTHKGMIFCLAVVCGALGRLRAGEKALTCQRLQDEIKAMCEHLVEEDLVHQKPHSAGMRFFCETGSLGIRGVAQSGFALVFEASLPFFMKQRSAYDEEMALKQTLLFLMSFVDDSTLWSRGGLEGLAFAKSEAQKILESTLEKDALDEALKHCDQTMISKNLSPGGSADLLALTWLLAQIVDS